MGEAAECRRMFKRLAKQAARSLAIGRQPRHHLFITCRIDDQAVIQSWLAGFGLFLG
jgi:hypothetical protein